MSYQEKLCHNYHELTVEEMRRYHTEDRFKFLPEDRFFFEGALGLPGEMYLAERKALYYTILKFRPAHCLEIGTHLGGGSTLFLACAFARLGAGLVVTLEKNEGEYIFAKSSYQKWLPGLLPFVTFLRGDRPELFTPFIGSNEGVAGCVFLDGSDISEETLEQYEFFKPFFRPGSILMAHDWGNPIYDFKMLLVKPIIMADPQWSLVLELRPPESLGFVVWQRK